MNNSFFCTVILSVATLCPAQDFQPQIPKVWDDSEVAVFETPLAQRDRSPRYMTGKEYYALRVRPIYRTYPAYATGREPKDYRESLRQKEPEVVFDPSKLRTKEDWIQAGKLVFESDVSFAPAPKEVVPPEVWNLPISKEGVIPTFFASYVIRKKGVVELGRRSCASCHTRVMPDGTLLEGAQGMVRLFGSTAGMTPERLRDLQDALWARVGNPWVQSKDSFRELVTIDWYAKLLQASRNGVFPRQGTSLTHPVHAPSLIGILDIRFLDATGLVRHRSIGDLMRYAVINSGLDMLADYGDFQPSQHTSSVAAEDGTRYSDEQLYAMALYIGSLQPPPNPNRVDDRVRRGQRIFGQQGCAGCHTPPLYTNNKLTPAIGFSVPSDLLRSGDVLNVSVGTDPTLALKTRRGTGFYKVPSLRGVWYRNAFGHGGWAETLEEWFDPERLKSNYEPKGFHMGPGPIKGHEFGLRLSSKDRLDLIAFLKTL